MATQILMPALSPTMEEGTLAKWFVKEGDAINSGDIIAEIETDKATMEFEAVDEGIIGKLLVSEGTEAVKVNTPIAILLANADDAIDTVATADTTPAIVTDHPKSDTPAPQSTTQTTPKHDKTRIFATPLARRIAADKSISLDTITGSGPHGRIVKADVIDVKPTAKVASTTLPSSPDADQIKALYKNRDYEEVTLDGMRKTIAQRLTKAKQTVPHFYLRRTVKIDNLLALRKQMNTGLEAQNIKISINDFIIKASARALIDVPNANVAWANDRILRFTAADIAVAVAVEGGLFTPVLRNAEQKTLSSLSTEMKALALKAQERKLSPKDYQGGSFAISNLGMMGIESFDAVINPPHGSILAVGAGVKKPVADTDGQIRIASIMSLTLSADHRAIDGALGAEFLGQIVHYLENPAAMLA